MNNVNLLRFNTNTEKEMDKFDKFVCKQLAKMGKKKPEIVYSKSSEEKYPFIDKTEEDIDKEQELLDDLMEELYPC